MEMAGYEQDGSDGPDFDDDDDEESIGEDDEEEGAIADSEAKSRLEHALEKAAARRRQREEENLREKHWSLRGETSAATRGEAGLAEAVLDVPSAVSMWSEPDSQFQTRAMQLLLRIARNDPTRDDPVRRLPPVDSVKEFKKKLVMEQEKSKSSLSQIYEEEARKEQRLAAAAEEDSPLHAELRTSYASLLADLRALSNAHYTPHAGKPEAHSVLSP